MWFQIIHNTFITIINNTKISMKSMKKYFKVNEIFFNLKFNKNGKTLLEFNLRVVRI